MAKGLRSGEDCQRAAIVDGPYALMPLMSWEKLKLNSEPELRPQNENAKLAPQPDRPFFCSRGRKTVSVSILGNQLLPWPSVRPSMHPSVFAAGCPRDTMDDKRVGFGLGKQTPSSNSICKPIYLKGKRRRRSRRGGKGERRRAHSNAPPPPRRRKEQATREHS